MHDGSIPKSLLDIQTWFANIITAALPETNTANLPIYPTGLIEEIRKQIAPSPTLKSEERMGIYQQQYWWRLLTVMQEIYPSLVRLFDYEDFNDQIAEPFLLKCPPNDWFLSGIGSRLPEWLEENYREKDARLVTELARLDRAYEKLIFADLLPKIDSAALQQCERKKLFLQPSVMLFELDVDLFAFRTQLLEHLPSYWLKNDFPPLKKSDEKMFFVLYRKNEIDFCEKISQPFYELLSRFQKGAKLIDLIPILEKCGNIVEKFQIVAERGWLSLTKRRLS